MQQMVGLGAAGRLPTEWRAVLAAVKSGARDAVSGLIEGSFDDVLLAQARARARARGAPRRSAPRPAAAVGHYHEQRPLAPPRLLPPPPPRPLTPSPRHPLLRNAPHHAQVATLAAVARGDEESLVAAVEALDEAQHVPLIEGLLRHAQSAAAGCTGDELPLEAATVAKARQAAAALAVHTQALQPTPAARAARPPPT